MSSPIGASGGDVTGLGIIGLKAAQKSAAVNAQVVTQALEGAKEIAQSAAPPQNGRGQVVDTFA
jgi:hypothetical protein